MLQDPATPPDLTLMLCRPHIEAFRIIQQASDDILSRFIHDAIATAQISALRFCSKLQGEFQKVMQGSVRSACKCQGPQCGVEVFQWRKNLGGDWYSQIQPDCALDHVQGQE